MALEIRPFNLADVPFGMLLTDGEEWHRTAPDWVRLVRLEPDGVFKAVADGIPAGTAGSLTMGRFAWIHSVIVLKELRHRGIGEALMRACLGFVDRRGIPCTKLDGVPGTEPFYARFGFIEEFPSWRLLSDGAAGTPKAARLEARDHPAVFAFDRAMTGLDRSRVLEALLAEYPDRAFLVRRRGRVRGYLLVRRGEWRDPIGPWVADPADPGVAADLLQSALASTRGKTFRMCVGGYHGDALKIAEEMGFTRPDHSTRMYRGQPFEESRACYGMISAEKG
jgi:GNAT superfamily N-acetyltransferase